MKPSREKLILAGCVMLTVVVVLAIWGRLRTGPPRSITFAAGSKSGAYYTIAKRYQEVLAPQGLDVRILETKGSRENLELLEAGKADIGFVQSGMKGSTSAELNALGSTFYEPVWVFTRGEPMANELLDLKGKKIAIGNVGSGTRDVAQALLGDNKLQNQVTTFDDTSDVAAQKLLAGEIDALFIVGSASIPVIKELANNPEVSLLNFERAQAYTRYHHSLTAVTLYRGMLNLSQDIPKTDHKLVATSATLVVKEKFHYALTTLILQTAERIHRPPGAFHQYDEFPNPRLVSFPLTPEADQFYKRGPSFFYRNLPFYVAASLDRLLIILLPLLTLILPLGRLLPPLYGWVLKRRIYKRQQQLAEIEINEDGKSRDELMADLEELESHIVDVKTLPPAYQNDVFLLQLRIERVRESLEREAP